MSVTVLFGDGLEEHCGTGTHIGIVEDTVVVTDTAGETVGIFPLASIRGAVVDKPTVVTSTADGDASGSQPLPGSGLPDALTA